MFLMETNVNRARMEALRVKLDFVGKLVVNCFGKSGGLCLFWSANIQVVLSSYSLAHIDVRLVSSYNRSWRLTGFSGNPDTNQSIHSWKLLRRLAGVLKDWNLRSGFRETVDDCAFEYLGYVGPYFAWCNKREGEALIHERLDRCVGSLEWKLLFPNFKVSQLDYWCSDLEFTDTLVASGEAKRKRSWKSIQLIESQLDHKLETEERYWKQRSRIDWLKYGDRSTHFFHKKATFMKAHNKIKGLLGDDGQWHESKRGMERIILDYFGHLFQSGNPSQTDISEILEGVQPTLSSSMSRFLDFAFTEDDIKKAVWDGLPPLFYQ
ncbi:hypothetical protein Ddye_010762 [Dipteronia dyeriana]|uniref:Reverse transcriptase n=1 Tax=Dipteronia dyeriana TaxID=168575 RepID=A0AAD9XE70_9ROSI|nr:hypothetical protein Ddye_010762 [Dipteronia dyeriana]